MAKISSEPVVVNAQPPAVFAFLSDINNIRLLLPQDRISEWSSDGTTCSFKVQNAYTITLVKNGGTQDSSIRWISGKGSPFEFSLEASLVPEGSATRGELVCDAKLNPFLEMMVRSPLKNLFDYMAGQLQQQFV